MLRLAFVTLFPEMIRAAMGDSIVNRAVQAGLVSFSYVNPRDFTTDKHRTVDDSPFGGEPGMLMKAEPIALAIESLVTAPGAIVIIPEPAAPRFGQRNANDLASASEIVFVCGHYEGIDERVSGYFNAQRFSVGDFVVTGGELPMAALMADAIEWRQLPGVPRNGRRALARTATRRGCLARQNYTRPEVWRDIPLPGVLISGHHAEIAKWRRREALRLTRLYRPELLESVELTKADKAFLSEEADKGGWTNGTDGTDGTHGNAAECQSHDQLPMCHNLLPASAGCTSSCLNLRFSTALPNRHLRRTCPRYGRATPSRHL